MAWRSLTQFVRATVLVAFVDAVGIMLVAIVLKVPFATAIGVLVFLGAFIPMIGATLSGSVAVLVALVAQGPIVALLMLAGVIVVQQIEAHVLQPFLLGRFVSVHPLGVIVAIGMGVLVAGIAGALVAVPLVAALNAVAQYLANYSAVDAEPAPTEVSGPRTRRDGQVRRGDAGRLSGWCRGAHWHTASSRVPGERPGTVPLRGEYRVQTPAPVDYARATSVEHALELLERLGPESRLIAGGHSLLPMMRIRLAQPECVIDINDLTDLDYVRVEGGELCIGAMTRHAGVLDSPWSGSTTRSSTTPSG